MADDVVVRLSTAEKSFHALKRELITYMRDDPPNNSTVRVWLAGGGVVARC